MTTDFDRIDGSACVRGQVRGGYVFPLPGKYTDGPDGLKIPGLWVPRGDWQKNLTLYGWGSLVGQLLRGSPDGKTYFINTMYMEYENGSGSPVTPPSYDRTGGKSYYDALVSDPNRDYLRLGITASSFISTDETLYPDGNRATFFSQSAGLVGVHGKPFSDANNSRVFGGALVSARDASDATQDIVHSRFYFSSASNQLVKVAGLQISLTWPIQWE